MDPETLYNVAAWIATALNSMVAVALYGFRRRNDRAGRPSRASAALTGLTGAALCCLAENILVLPYAGPFGLIRLAQYNLAVTTAAVGAAVAFDSWWRRGDSRLAPGLLLSAALMLPGIVIAHSAFVAPYRLQIERTEIALDAGIEADAPIRVVVLADLQTDRVGAHENAAFDAALAERPDLILMPGDLFHASEPRWNKRKLRFRALIDRLEAPAGVFAVQGNTDFVNRLRPFLEPTPVRFLEDEVVTVDVRGTRIAIGGLQLNFHSASADAALDRLVATDADVRILLAHYPDAIEIMGRVEGIDLLVAGHTHGGQIVIPGFGPPMTLSDVPRKVAAGGLHTINGRRIYVSRGIGMERGAAPPVRFFCPPEVSVLTLR